MSSIFYFTIAQLTNMCFTIDLLFRPVLSSPRIVGPVHRLSPPQPAPVLKGVIMASGLSPQVDRVPVDAEVEAYVYICYIKLNFSFTYVFCNNKKK